MDKTENWSGDVGVRSRVAIVPNFSILLHAGQSPMTLIFNLTSLISISVASSGCMRGAPAGPSPIFVDSGLVEPSHAYSCGLGEFAAGTFSKPVETFIGSHKIVFDDSPLPSSVQMREADGGTYLLVMDPTTKSPVVDEEFIKPADVFLRVPQGLPEETIQVLVVSKASTVEAKAEIFPVDGEKFKLLLQQPLVDFQVLRASVQQNDVAVMGFYQDGGLTLEQLEVAELRAPGFDPFGPRTEDFRVADSCWVDDAAQTEED